MFKWSVGIGIFCLLLGCSLNASQEKALSTQLALYLRSMQDSSRLAIVARTHPAYVRYVRDRGPAYFKEVFGTAEAQEYVSYDQVLKKVETKGAEIHALYTIRKYDEPAFELVAISPDKGQSWFFMQYAAYKDKKICTDIPRLLL
jgi:hypothetical protein